MKPAVTPSPDGTVWLHGGQISAKARPVAHRPTTAQLVLLGTHALPSTADLTRWLASLVDHGYERVRSGALTTVATGIFATHGFEPVQELALLARGRPRLFHPPRRRIRPMHATDVAAAAAVDSAAFPPGWGMDDAGLTDVCHATPAHRARVVDHGGRLVGMAISGRDAELGFIQRLAVHPDRQRRGVADTLVADSLRWMARCRVQRVLVNTHVDNVAALALYHRHGFAVLPERLHVCERAL